MTENVKIARLGSNSKLKQRIRKNKERNFLYPVTEQTKIFCQYLYNIQTNKGFDIILDSCCGTGDSSFYLQKGLKKNEILVAIDKSPFKLRKAINKMRDKRIFFIRGNVLDLWSGLYLEKVSIKKHYLLYPNPWPKQKHMKKRWYAHAILPTMLKFTKELEVRTNWYTYATECLEALTYYEGLRTEINEIRPVHPISAFEKKYFFSSNKLYRVNASKL